MVRVRSSLPVLDVLLAGVLVVAAAFSQAADPHVPQPWISIVATIWTGGVVLRTVAPFAMVVVASLGAVGYAAFPVHTTLLVSFVTLLVVGFSAGANLAGRRLWLAEGLLVCSTYVVQIATAQRPGGDTGFGDVYVSPLVLIGVPVVGGMLLRRSRHQTAELRRLGSELTSEREEHARDAAAAERNRIARELHDVISHSVSVMVVQAGAAEQQLPAESPAREQLLAVRRTGKEALTELRRQLGVLREGPNESPTPMPSLADVAGLANDSGATLEYDAATLCEVPPGMSLAAYRVVQESLTNARRHAAGAPVRVWVGRDDDRLVVDVVNGPGHALTDGLGGGHGITGMRERVAMYAGRLEAGPTSEGGWGVHARLPFPPAPVAR
ncbi:MAG: sensor histidine kinase [Marmoricola sp.]